MADEVEVDSKDLQDTIEELHKERQERQAEERQTHWTRYIALSTALLAGFGAIAAEKSGSLANEGMMHQLQASDKWNEYQASRQKQHLYSIAAASLLDAGTKQPPSGHGSKLTLPDLKPRLPDDRLAAYLDEVKKETDKSKDLSSEATKLQNDGEEEMTSHHRFAYAVALLQVAIALGAVAALTRIKYIWVFSIVAGAFGVGYFVFGFMPGK